jgi:putative sterol carrier protein
MNLPFRANPNAIRSLILLTLISATALPASAANERASVTPQDVFDSMREVFHADKAAGVHARYQWELTGPHGGDWWIEVNDGKFKMGKGRIANADVTFVLSDRDWVAISNDQLSGVWAVISGRMKVRGSQTLARKLDEMF